MKNIVEEHVAFQKNIHAPWMKTSDEYLTSSIVKPIDSYYFEDALALVYRIVTRGDPRAPVLPSFHLFKRHPLLCGLMNYAMQLRLRACGINFASLSGCALTVAHLYNAARKEGFCGHDWKDMANFVKLHRGKHLQRASTRQEGRLFEPLLLCCWRFFGGSRR